jgi:hypothetical protein
MINRNFSPGEKVDSVFLIGERRFSYPVVVRLRGIEVGTRFRSESASIRFKTEE